VAAIRCSDDDEVELCRPVPHLVGRAEDDDIGMLPKRLGAALLVAGHHNREPEAGRGGDERGVED
jgi:hypothetical protein